MHSAFTAGRRQKTVASHGSEKLESNLLQVSAKEREALLILALYCSHYKQMHFLFSLSHQICWLTGELGKKRKGR